jgi:hypothetical protein
MRHCSGGGQVCIAEIKINNSKNYYRGRNIGWKIEAWDNCSSSWWWNIEWIHNKDHSDQMVLLMIITGCKYIYLHTRPGTNAEKGRINTRYLFHQIISKNLLQYTLIFLQPLFTCIAIDELDQHLPTNLSNSDRNKIKTWWSFFTLIQCDKLEYNMVGLLSATLLITS